MNSISPYNWQQLHSRPALHIEKDSRKKECVRDAWSTNLLFGNTGRSKANGADGCDGQERGSRQTLLSPSLENSFPQSHCKQLTPNRFYKTLKNKLN